MLDHSKRSNYTCIIIKKKNICLVYTCAVDFHFEFVKVEPMSGLLGVKVMITVSSCKAKTVEPEVRGQQETGWTFLICYTRVSSLPPSVREYKEKSNGKEWERKL